MKKQSLLAVALLFLMAWPTMAHAGAWTLDRNHFYLQLGTAFTFANDRWNTEGTKVPITVQKLRDNGQSISRSNFQQLMTDLYFEFGLLKRLTLFGNFAFLNSLRQKNPGGDISYTSLNVGDLMLGARFGIITDPFVLALETRLTIPTGDQNAIIPTGAGDFRGELRLSAAKAFAFPLLVGGEVGFMLRGSTTIQSAAFSSGGLVVNYAPELYVQGFVGSQYTFRRYGMYRIFGSVEAAYRTSTSQPDLGAVDTFSIIPPNSRLATVGATVLWYFLPWLGVNVHYQQAVYGHRLPVMSNVGGAIFATY